MTTCSYAKPSSCTSTTFMCALSAIGPSLSRESSTAMVDLYELTNPCIAAKAISAPLHQLKDHVIRPLWQAFGYPCYPFLVGSAMLSIKAVTDKYYAQMVSPSVRRAYSLLLQICCSPACLLSQPPTHQLHQHHIMVMLACIQKVVDI